MKKVERGLSHIDSFVSGLSLVVVILITLAGVIMRKVIGKPFAWLEEMQLLFFLYAIFFGASVAFRKGSQVSIDLIANRLSPKAKKILDIFDYVVTMGVLLYLCWGGIRLMSSVSGKVTPYFKISYTYIDLAAPLGMLLMIIQYTIIIIRVFRDEPPYEGGEEV